MKAPRARTMPVVIFGHNSNKPVIKPWPMGFEKSEEWLQKLVHEHPELLPIDTIEPALGPVVPAAMEVACGHGWIDNILLTANGDIVLLEVKLWKNPELRREVVAQTLDYISSLTGMGYDAFEAAVLKARGDHQTSLHALIPEEYAPLAEAEFVNAVARNLKRGRILALVVGDGIREETERLVELVQGHAGAHFTLALVAISFFVNLVTDDLIAVPDTLMRTVMVERGIVTLEEGVPIVKPVSAKASATVRTMSTELFEEALTRTSPTLPAKLQSFVDDLSRLGVYTEQKKTLFLFARVAGVETPIKLGYVDTAGRLWTDVVLGAAPAAAARQYLATLAYLIGGSVADSEKYPRVINTKGATPPVTELLDGNRAGWIGAIEAFITQVQTLANANEDRA